MFHEHLDNPLRVWLFDITKGVSPRDDLQTFIKDIASALIIKIIKLERVVGQSLAMATFENRKVLYSRWIGHRVYRRTPSTLNFQIDDCATLGNDSGNLSTLRQ